MAAEALSPAPPMSVRADVARLTLQLRAALRDAEAAEAEAAAVDGGAALAELRGRLEPLMGARRRSLEDALAKARADAVAAVIAAQRDAVAIVSEPKPPVAEGVPEAEPSPVVEQLPAVEPAAVEVVGPSAPAHQWPPPVPAAMVPPITVVIDAEAFARVFATLLASLPDERFAAWRPGVAWPSVPASADTVNRAKPSFWKQAWHIDVLLVGLAAVIVLVILASWLG